MISKRIPRSLPLRWSWFLPPLPRQLPAGMTTSRQVEACLSKLPWEQGHRASSNKRAKSICFFRYSLHGERISAGTELAVIRVIRENILHNSTWFREKDVCRTQRSIFLMRYCAKGSALPEVDLRFCQWLLLLKFWTCGSELSSIVKSWKPMSERKLSSDQ